MENLDNLASQALERYFKVVEKTGYVNERDTNKLMLLLFLQNIIDNYSYYITEEDYNLINRIIVCLYSTSCLIPFAQYQSLIQPIDNYLLNIPIKITELDDIRHSQRHHLRLVNQ